MATKPSQKPQRPFFSAGPTVRNADWSLTSLSNALHSRSHRSIDGKARLAELIQQTREVLEIPADYRIALIAGSATGAIECLLWSLLGPRPVDCISIDIFSGLWAQDVKQQLQVDHRHFNAPFGVMPDLSTLDPEHDWLFGWNGTTSGLSFPDGTWIPADRQGLTICDATSAAFGYDLPWDKLDATAFSWQKGLGSEAAHGMIVLSPCAVERLMTYIPPWPMPRIFKLMKENHLNEGIFRGETLNTPSLLAVEDCLQALTWAKGQGGLQGLLRRTRQNFAILDRWIEETPGVEFTVTDPRYRSQTSPCFTIAGYDRPAYQALYTKISQEGAGFDFLNHALTEPSLRLWTGPTVETADLQSFLPWATWAIADI